MSEAEGATRSEAAGSAAEGPTSPGSLPSRVPSPLPPPPTLPIANISRLMKLSIPSTSKISLGAKDVMAVCVCEFIAFLTSEANDRCGGEKRKTISGDDVLYAMKVLGFEDYEMVCRVWLSRIRMAQDSSASKGAGGNS